MGRRSRGGACIELGKKVKLETRAIAVKQIQEIIKYLNLVILNDFLSNSSFSLRCRHYLTPPVLDPTIGGGGGETESLLLRGCRRKDNRRIARTALGNQTMSLR